VVGVRERSARRDVPCLFGAEKSTPTVLSRDQGLREFWEGRDAAGPHAGSLGIQPHVGRQ